MYIMHCTTCSLAHFFWRITEKSRHIHNFWQAIHSSAHNFERFFSAPSGLAIYFTSAYCRIVAATPYEGNIEPQNLRNIKILYFFAEYIRSRLLAYVWLSKDMRKDKIRFDAVFRRICTFIGLGVLHKKIPSACNWCDLDQWRGTLSSFFLKWHLLPIFTMGYTLCVLGQILASIFLFFS